MTVHFTVSCRALAGGTKGAAGRTGGHVVGGPHPERLGRFHSLRQTEVDDLRRPNMLSEEFSLVSIKLRGILFMLRSKPVGPPGIPALGLPSRVWHQGSVWGRYGVGMGSVKDRYGVGMGSVWVGLGSVWGRFEVGRYITISNMNGYLCKF